MEAAILAAGRGTRLRPLTFSTPKALVPVLNRPLLGLWLEILKAAGVRRVAINTHHLAGQVEEFLQHHAPPGLQVLLRYEPVILGTGGGLRSLLAALEGDPILAVNADILTDLDLKAVFKAHRREALATLVLQDFPPLANVEVAPGGRITAIGKAPAGASGRVLAYTGIQVVSRRLLRWLPPGGPADLVTAWQGALHRGELLYGQVVTGTFWQDLGTPEAYLLAHRRLLAGESPLLSAFFPPLRDPFLGKDVRLGEGVCCEGNVCLGDGVEVGPRTRLADVVAWEGARIGPGLTLRRCIIGKRAEVLENARSAILV